jgi:hypothetical protein
VHDHADVGLGLLPGDQLGRDLAGLRRGVDGTQRSGVALRAVVR